ncbi:hypothetical protein RRF57_012940 [Xylaria bambusicola]|uniref:Protein kinase domain-containing protein n=1 Tax=Xylaria bambusicola TaxID=326684 RepID=A0AAN7UXG6_9PEZI
MVWILFASRASCLHSVSGQLQLILRPQHYILYTEGDTKSTKDPGIFYVGCYLCKSTKPLESMGHSDGGHDAESIQKFVQDIEARQRPRALYSTGSYPSNLESKEGIPSQHDSDVVSRVADYGFEAWARNSEITKPSHDSNYFIGLENLDEKEAKTPEYGLQDTLEEAMHPQFNNDTQTYLPLGQLEAICRRDVVHRELSHTFGATCCDIDRYTDYVCGRQDNPGRDKSTSRKIFAILVLLGQLQRINDFWKAGIEDRHLPFRREYTGGTLTLFKRSVLNRQESEPALFFDSWKNFERRKFYETQWRLLSPYFGRASDDTVALYELDEQCIMPWVNIGEEKRGSFMPSERNGGFSKVTKIFIHPDHHAFPSEVFAIKQLDDSGDIPFQQEFKNLKRVETRTHLLTVYAAYRRGKQYSFIFPWADGGSLDELWAKNPLVLKEKMCGGTHEDSDAGRTQRFITWLAGQFCGLTGRCGLGFLHDTQDLTPPQQNLVVPEETEKKFGIHGDIKPGNILYFEQEEAKGGSGLGLFKISDFGLTGFHSTLTKSQAGPPGPHSPTYRAPEFREYAAYLSRKYDIWSLGCVMLQFLTWLISGPDGLKQFDDARVKDMDQTDLQIADDKFFIITQNGGAAHKPSVQDHIINLQSKVTKDKYLYGCLALIKDKMLELDNKIRANCEEVHRALASSYERCRMEDDYADSILPELQEIRCSHLLLRAPQFLIFLLTASGLAQNPKFLMIQLHPIKSLIYLRP